jgi:hypothetical protein
VTMYYATFPASAETSLVRSECATALRVHAFDKRRGLVGFPPIGQALTCPYGPIRSSRGFPCQIPGRPFSTMPMLTTNVATLLKDRGR